MIHTECLGLNLPELSDNYMLADWNENYEILDNAVHQIAVERNADMADILTEISEEETERANGDAVSKDLGLATGVLAVGKGGTGSETLAEGLQSQFETLTESNIEELPIANQNILCVINDVPCHVSMSDITEYMGLRLMPTATVVAWHGQGQQPGGWLLCDGGKFDIEAYPLLYTALGVDTVPDLRECALVGAGKNTTDAIATHDVFNVGEFKDDQLQTHTHTYGTGVYFARDTLTITVVNPGWDGSRVTQGVEGGRWGDTTHGKRYGVRYIIKAV